MDADDYACEREREKESVCLIELVQSCQGGRQDSSAVTLNLADETSHALLISDDDYLVLPFPLPLLLSLPLLLLCPLLLPAPVACDLIVVDTMTIIHFSSSKMAIHTFNGFCFFQ